MLWNQLSGCRGDGEAGPISGGDFSIGLKAVGFLIDVIQIRLFDASGRWRYGRSFNAIEWNGPQLGSEQQRFKGGAPEKRRASSLQFGRNSHLWNTWGCYPLHWSPAFDCDRSRAASWFLGRCGRGAELVPGGASLIAAPNIWLIRALQSV